MKFFLQHYPSILLLLL